MCLCLQINSDRQISKAIRHVVPCAAAAATDARASPGAGETGGPATGLCIPAAAVRLHPCDLCLAAPKRSPAPTRTGACGSAESKSIVSLFWKPQYLPRSRESNPKLKITFFFFPCVGANPPGEPHQVPHPAGSEATGEGVPLHHSG